MSYHPAPRESRSTELGLELRCGRCREFWPADSQFFYRNLKGSDGFHTWCIACCNSSVYDARAAAGHRRPGDNSIPHSTWSPLLAWSNPKVLHLPSDSGGIA